MMPIFRAASAAAALMWFQSAAADPALNDLAARTELHAFESLTLTDQQFLTGDKSGKIVTLAGELRLPQGAAGRLKTGRGFMCFHWLASMNASG